MDFYMYMLVCKKYKSNVLDCFAGIPPYNPFVIDAKTWKKFSRGFPTISAEKWPGKFCSMYLPQVRGIGD